MKAIEPNVVPRKGTAPPRHTGDLVFLDLNDAPSAAKSATARRATQGLDVIATGGQPGLAAGSAAGAPPQAPKPPPAAPPAAPPSAATPEPPSLLEELDLTSLDTGSFTNDPTSTLGTSGLEPAVLDGMIRSADLEGVEPTSGGLLDGLQTTGFGDDAPAADAGAMLDLEPTSFKAPAASRGPAAASADDLLDFDMPAFGSAGGLEGGGSPLQDLPLVGGGDSPPFSDDEPSIGGDLDLIMPEDAGGAGEAEPADIPLMDLELPASPAPAPPVAPPKAPLTPPPLARERAPAAKRHDPYRAKQPPEAPAPARAAAAPARRDELAPHGSTDAAVHSVEALQAMAKGRPDDHALRRRLAEAMLDAGDREGGLRELETAMVGYERANDLAGAAALADEIVHLSPDSLRHHQKRVEYAFRQNEHGRLIESYLELGDALFRSGQVEKSRAIYQRVLDLAPHDVRAQTALESFPSAEPGPAPMRSNGRAGPPPTAPRRAAPAAAAPRRGSDDEFVNLGDWLRGEEAPKDTRMVVQEQKPSGDEQADFQDMLRKFKQGIAENVEEEDHQAHYDLGVAYKEMGLTDEAIAEFQKALRAPANRVPAYEALGQCFMEKDQYPMAATILSRALSEKGVSEDQLVGVLYLLGRCAEERGQYDVALDFYQRVFVVDIQFRDVGDRLAAVEGASS
jgi:tetratricopeptide (TPR) repeat protein